jgi:hypothetical protein
MNTETETPSEYFCCWKDCNAVPKDTVNLPPGWSIVEFLHKLIMRDIGEGAKFLLCPVHHECFVKNLKLKVQE